LVATQPAVRQSDPPVPAGTSRKHGRPRRPGAGITPYTFVLPFFVVFGAFGLFPLIYTAWVSLYKVNLGTPEKMTWLGFKNYDTLLHSEFFWNALKNTFIIGVISSVPQLMMALGIAHLLNYKLRARTFFRVSVLMPYATSLAAAALIFAGLFGRDYGMINWFLGLFGVDHMDWESGEWTSKIAISVIVTWRWVGYNALIYLASMQSIPDELYESAAIDGASKWQQFRYVTIPSLRPTILFTIIISTIGATQIFAEPLLYGGISGHRGGADRQYQTLAVLLYDEGWFNGKLGYGAAIAWTMFVLIVIVVLINATLARGRRRNRV
jgi:cellobiose transport system permease protein